MKTLLIDFSLYAYRMYYGAPDLETSTGVPSGFEFMMLRNLESLSKKYNLILCQDSGHGGRKEISDKYKANRSLCIEDAKQSDIWPRLEILIPALACKYKFANAGGFEADDVMYSLCNEDCDILTNDRDLFACITKKVSVLTSFRSKITEWDYDKFFRGFVIRPFHWWIYRTFQGDKSDNIKGIGRFRKRLIAEACRQCIHTEEEAGVWGLAKVNKYLIPKASPSELSRLTEFWESGQAITNHELIVLRRCEVFITEISLDESYNSILDKFELESLKTETEF